MSRGHPKRRNSARFVRLMYPMLDSPAFNHLRSSSVMVLISILRRHNGYNGTKDDPIVCPYSAMKGKLAAGTIANGIRELEAFGFIERVRRGGLMKQSNTYELLTDWRSWQPEKTEGNSKKWSGQVQ